MTWQSPVVGSHLISSSKSTEKRDCFVRVSPFLAMTKKKGQSYGNSKRTEKRDCFVVPVALLAMTGEEGSSSLPMVCHCEGT